MARFDVPPPDDDTLASTRALPLIAKTGTASGSRGALSTAADDILDSIRQAHPSGALATGEAMARQQAASPTPQPAPPRRAAGPPRQAPVPEGKLGGYYGGRYYPEGKGEQLEAMAAAGDPEAGRALELWRKRQRELPGIGAREARLFGDVQEQKAQTAKMELALVARQRSKEAGIAAEQAEFEQEQGEVQAQRRKAQEGARLAYARQQEAADLAVSEHKIEDRRDVGQRIFDGLAAALGALGSGLTGQPNLAMEAIDKRIARDIESQREELQSKRGKATAVRSELGAYLDAFGQEDHAIEALRARKYSEFAAMAQRVGGEAQGARAQWKLKEIAQLADARRESVEIGLQKQAATGQLVQQQAAQRARAAALAARPKKWQAGFGTKGRPNLNELFVDLGGGLGGIAPTARVADEIRTANEAQAKLDALLGEQLHLTQKTGASVDAVLLGKIKSNESEIVTTVAVLKGLGAISKPDKTLVTDFAGGDPTEMLRRKDRTVAGLKNARQIVQMAWRQKLTATGMPAVQRRMGAEGPEYRYTGEISGGGLAASQEGAPVLE